MNIDKFLTRIIIGKGKEVKCRRWSIDTVGEDGLRDCALSLEGITLENAIKIAENAVMIDETPEYIVWQDKNQLGWLHLVKKN